MIFCHLFIIFDKDPEYMGIVKVRNKQTERLFIYFTCKKVMTMTKFMSFLMMLPATFFGWVVTSILGKFLIFLLELNNLVLIRNVLGQFLNIMCLVEFCAIIIVLKSIPHNLV